MTPPRLFIEPFAGAAAITLRLVGSANIKPPVAWMGGKRRLAPVILRLMGLRTSQGAQKILLNDAGPRGRVWPYLSTYRGAEMVAKVLDGWHHSGVPIHVRWEMLKDEGPRADPAEWVAQWLLLQSRSANGVPVFWADESLVQGSGGGRRPQPAGQRGRVLAVARSRGQAAIQSAWQCGGKLVASDGRGIIREAGQRGVDQPRWGGIRFISTISQRVRVLGDLLSSRDVRCSSGPGEDLVPPPEATLGGCYVYLDPPYRGCTGYGWDVGRAALLELAGAWARAGAVVAISEAEGLAAELGTGWHQVDVTAWGGGKPEWVTLSVEPRWMPARQLRLFPFSDLAGPEITGGPSG